MNQFYCPPGHNCPEGSAQPLACTGESGNSQDGVYQNQKGAAECEICPAGYYCFDKVTTFHKLYYFLDYKLSVTISFSQSNSILISPLFEAIFTVLFIRENNFFLVNFK
jgi:hypothetical protein